MIDLRSPCKCGHRKANHLLGKCNERDIIDPFWSCKCHDFLLNNLKYLEQLYREKQCQR